MAQAYYQNPIAKNGDFADPFVLRWNGRYYLYCTNPDLRCWSSEDLVHWAPEGPVIAPGTFPGLVPFAPEVVYSSGKFYMYTSPSGLGHYVLESERPTGPFYRISENLGHAIDGSVFIDDDGKWYFYWAGDEGIWGCEMASPTQFGEPVLTGASLRGWTEGPLVRKAGGIYYMTYTGNHYLSSGYRIQTAWSRHPLQGYTDDPFNPAVLCTGGGVTGLGHSSTVLGPDLVSHYLVYHNLNPDASRELNIDRQLWHGEATQVLGPTVMPQPAPGLPGGAFPAGGDVPQLEWEFAGAPWQQEEGLFWGGGEGFEALTKQAFGPLFTAEFHLRLPRGGGAERGVVLWEAGGARRYELAFSENGSCVTLLLRQGAQARPLARSALPAGYEPGALHCLRVERAREALTLWVDDRLQLKAAAGAEQAPLRLGYFSRGGKIGCGFTAATDTVYEEALRGAAIPAGCSIAPVFGCRGGSPEPGGRLRLEEGETARYTLWVPQAGEYALCVILEGGAAGLAALLDGKALPPAPRQGALQRFALTLGRGEHELCLAAAGSAARLVRLEVHTAAKGFLPPGHPPALAAGPWGKRLWGEGNAGDYAVRAELKFQKTGEGGRAGLLLRVTQPAEGGEGADPVLGIDFFLGYSVSFTGKECVIARHRYDRRVLAACPCELPQGAWFTLCAAVEGSRITVRLNGCAAPLLTVCDEAPLTHGCYGLWAENAQAEARDLSVTEFE